MSGHSPAARNVYLVAHPGADLYGSDRVVLETVDALVQSGAEVVVTLPADGPLVPHLRERGARVVFTPTLVVRRSLLSPRGLISLVSQTVRGLIAGNRLLRDIRPTVVWTNTITIPLWIVVARLSHAQSVVHVHEAESSAPRFLMRVLTSPLLLAQHVVANSNFTASVLQDLFPSLERRCTVVYNGVVGPETYQPPRPALDSALRVLYLGRLSPRKGPDLLIRAIAELAHRGIPAQLQIVGAVFPGYEWFEQELREAILALKLEESVTLSGFTESPWQSLADCDVLVVPSRLEESFGNTVVEGILAARPVIVSDSSGLREAAWGYQSAQQVEPGNIQGIVDALTRTVERWPVMSLDAIEDEKTARARHSVALYQDHIIGVVSHVRAANDVRENSEVAIQAQHSEA